MAPAPDTFRQCLVNAPKYGSDDDHLGSRVFFDLHPRTPSVIPLYHSPRSLPSIIPLYHFPLSLPSVTSLYYSPLSLPAITSLGHFPLLFPAITSLYHFPHRSFRPLCHSERSEESIPRPPDKENVRDSPKFPTCPNIRRAKAPRIQRSHPFLLSARSTS